MKKEKKRGTVSLFLEKDFFNSIVSVLSAFIEADTENKYSVYAARLKKKIMQYSRTFSRNGEDNAAIYFYEQEAAMLIKLLAIYNCAVTIPTEDFYQQTVRQKGGKPTKKRAAYVD